MTEPIEQQQEVPLPFDDNMIYLMLSNSKKQLQYVEHDYNVTFKKYNKLVSNPQIENQLTGSIWYLDMMIEKEKQTQVEYIQNQRQIDRLQTKAINEKRAGGHTDKISLTDKNIEKGEKYQKLIKEFQLVENQIQ